jgi:RES domain-containing protein
VSVEVWSPEKLLRGAAADDNIASRTFGDQWLARLRSAVLMVPFAVTKYEQNIVINPLHADFKWIGVSPAEAVKWAARLFVQI